MPRASWISKTALTRTSVHDPNKTPSTGANHKWSLRQRTAVYYIIEVCDFSADDACAIFNHIFWDEFRTELPNYLRLADEWSSRNLQGRSSMFRKQIDKTPGHFTTEELDVRTEVKSEIILAMGALWEHQWRDEFIGDMITKLQERDDGVATDAIGLKQKGKQPERDAVRDNMVKRLSAAAQSTPTSNVRSDEDESQNGERVIVEQKKKRVVGSPAKAASLKRSRRATQNVNYSVDLDVDGSDGADDYANDEDHRDGEPPAPVGDDGSGESAEEQMPKFKGHAYVPAETKKSTDAFYDDEEHLMRVRLGNKGATTRRSLAASMSPAPADLPYQKIISSRSIGEDPRNRLAKKPRRTPTQRSAPTDEQEEVVVEVPQHDGTNDEDALPSDQQGDIPNAGATIAKPAARLTPARRRELQHEQHRRRVEQQKRMLREKEERETREANETEAQPDLEMGKVEHSTEAARDSESARFAAPETHTQGNHDAANGLHETSAPSAPSDQPPRLPDNWYTNTNDPTALSILATDPNIVNATPAAQATNAATTSTDWIPAPPHTTAVEPTSADQYIKIPMYHYNSIYRFYVTPIPDHAPVPQTRSDVPHEDVYARGGKLISLPSADTSSPSGLIMCCDGPRCLWCSGQFGLDRALPTAGHEAGLPFVHTKDCEFTFEWLVDTREWKYRMEFKGDHTLPTEALPTHNGSWVSRMTVDEGGEEKFLNVLVCYAPRCELCKDYVPDNAN